MPDASLFDMSKAVPIVGGKPLFDMSKATPLTKSAATPPEPPSFLGGLYDEAAGLGDALLGTAESAVNLPGQMYDVVRHPIDTASQLWARHQASVAANTAAAARINAAPPSQQASLINQEVAQAPVIDTLSGGPVDPAHPLRAWGQAGGNVLIGSAIGKGVDRMVGPYTPAANTPAAIPKQRANLAAAAEMGGAAPPGVSTFEDVATPNVLKAVRAETANQRITSDDLKGRSGYRLAQGVTSNVRQGYDAQYNNLLDPIRNEPVPEASKTAARSVIAKVQEQAGVLDKIQNTTTNSAHVSALADTIENASTIGQLDDLRKTLNQLNTTLEGGSDASQYQASLLRRSLIDGADSIRNSLYPAVADLYKGTVDEASIRQLQLDHGAAIQLDQLIKNTAVKMSAAASEEAAPMSLLARLRGLAGPATLRPTHAAGRLIGAIWPPSTVEEFNTRFGRAIEGATPQAPTRPLTPPPGRAPAAPLPTQEALPLSRTPLRPPLRQPSTATFPSGSALRVGSWPRPPLVEPPTSYQPSGPPQSTAQLGGVGRAATAQLFPEIERMLSGETTVTPGLENPAGVSPYTPRSPIPPQQPWGTGLDEVRNNYENIRRMFDKARTGQR